jgi:hypothetical protein
MQPTITEGPRLEKLTINQASGATPITGSAIHYGTGNSTNITVGFRAKDITINQTWNGVFTDTGTATSWIENIFIYNTANTGVYYDVWWGGGNTYSNVQTIGPNASVYVAAGDTTTFDHLMVSQGNIIFGPQQHIGSGYSIVNNLTLVNPSIENFVGCAFDFSKALPNPSPVVNNLTIIGTESEDSSLFCAPQNVSNLNYTNLMLYSSKNPSVSQTLQAIDYSSVPGDLICAAAADTTISNLAITTGSISGGVATLNASFGTSQFGYTLVGQKFGILNLSGTAVLGAGPFTVTAANRQAGWIQFSTAATGTITGGTLYRWCENQSQDGIYSGYKTFALNSSGTFAMGPINNGPTWDVRGQLNFWTSSAPPQISVQLSKFQNGNYITPQSSLQARGAEVAFDVNLLDGTPDSCFTSTLCHYEATFRSFVGPFATAPTSIDASGQPGDYATMFAGYALQLWWATTGVVSVNSGSAGTISGVGTCTLATFNSSCSGTTATVTFPTSGSWSGATFVVNTRGQACSTAPTTATLTSGTATCSGTATLTTTLGGASGNAVELVALTSRP